MTFISLGVKVDGMKMSKLCQNLIGFSMLRVNLLRQCQSKTQALKSKEADNSSGCVKSTRDKYGRGGENPP